MTLCVSRVAITTILFMCDKMLKMAKFKVAGKVTGKCLFFGTQAPSSRKKSWLSIALVPKTSLIHTDISAIHSR